MKNWTLPLRIGVGFGIVLLLLVGLGLTSLGGLGSVVKNAREVIIGNRLDANLAQREVDHLNWAGSLSELLTDDDVHELHVETDHARCAFGEWYYGPERKALEERFPTLAPLLAELEEPHRRLHESAIEIEAAYQPSHGDLLTELNEILVAHLQWKGNLGDELGFEADHAEGDFQVSVQKDHTLCGLGKYMADPATQELARNFPALDRFLEAVEEPHQTLHGTAHRIEDLVNQGRIEDAHTLYQTETAAALEEIKAAFAEVIAAEKEWNASSLVAGRLYAEETMPALKRVQELLNELRAEAKAHVLTDDKMLAAAEGVEILVLIITVVAVVLGSAFAVILGLGLRRSLVRVAEQLRASSCEVSAASTQVSSSSQGVAEASSQQASSIEETSASLEELSSMTARNTENASKAAGLTQQALEAGTRARSAMDSTRQAMTEIAAGGEATAKIIKTVEEIAFQTNLLALNAAVEAARAGEAGAGFAVVADEVRSLALRAGEAAKNTAELIEASSRQIQTGGAAVDTTVGVFTELENGVREIAALTDEIRQASSEQATGVNQISEAVSQVDHATQASAANAEESAAAASELHGQAGALAQQVAELRRMVTRQEGTEAAPPTSASRPSQTLTPPSRQSGSQFVST